jgi:hypothetical protein
MPADRDGHGRRRKERRSDRGPRGKPGPIGLARIEGDPGAFELLHPRRVLETELDYQEGLDLWKAGEPGEARDALRYALEACHDNLWVHVALGRIALEDFKDPVLARGHFGYAVELVRKSLPAGFSGRLPRDRPANMPFFEAAAGLDWCLRAMGKPRDADALCALVERLTRPA